MNSNNEQLLSLLVKPCNRPVAVVIGHDPLREATITFGVFGWTLV